MDYYLKYIKYKNKYLSLKGGKIPEIENEHYVKKYLPLNYSEYTLTLNNKVIKEGNDITYNLNSKFEYEQINQVIPDIVSNYYLFIKDIIKINDIEIPFQTLFLENLFNIIIKLRELLTSNYAIPTFIQLINDEDKKLIESIESILNNNKCDESLYTNEMDYTELKKQIKDNINFINKNKLKISFDDNRKLLSSFNLEKDKLTKNLKDNSNFIKILKDEIKNLDIQDTDYILKKSKIEEYISNYDRQIYNDNSKLKSLINKSRENNLDINADKNICNIIKFKSIVNDSSYNEQIKQLVKENKMKLIEDIFKKYFNITDTNLYIGISVKSNILNKYIFINKIRELLEILYSDSESYDQIKTQIINLYDNKDAFINISDMMELYEQTINSATKPDNDKIIVYSSTINDKTNTDAKKEKKFEAYIKNEIKLIMELKDFIKYCDIIDNADGLKEFLKIKTSILFFASFIGGHFDKLTFNNIDNNLFPINIDNLICNLLKIDNYELNIKNNKLITKEKERNNFIKNIQTKIKNLNNKFIHLYNNDTLITQKIDSLYKEWEDLELDIDDLKLLDYEDFKQKYNNSKDLYKIYKYNKILDDKYYNNIDKIKKNQKDIKKNEQKLALLLNNDYSLFEFNNLPKVFKYGNAMFEGNQFPDCVENALLHFVRAIIWDPNTKKYNYNFLPETSNEELKEFVTTLKIGNENTIEIKNKFNQIIQNKSEFCGLYKQRSEDGIINYEIKSNINNFKTVLNYLFGITDSINHKYLNKNINKITENNISIHIEYTNILYILAFNIYDGHTVVSKIITNPNILLNYTYINLIYLLTSNYNNYKITNFNIYNYYLQHYIDKNVPFYLIFLLLDENVYLLSKSELNGNILSNINYFEKIFNNIEIHDLKKLISKLELYEKFIYYIQFLLEYIDDNPESMKVIKLYLSYLKLFNLESDIFYIEINDVLLTKLSNKKNKSIINEIYDLQFNDVYPKYLKVSIFDYLCLSYDFEHYTDDSKDGFIEILNELLDHLGNREYILNERNINLYLNKYDTDYDIDIDYNEFPIMEKMININIREILLKDDITIKNK